MKKKLLIIFLLIPFTVKAELKPIYNTLEDAVNDGLAKEYTREHQDTTDDTGTEKIYHWFATNDDTADAINEKRNILFAGFCWQSIRTTDSGGTKLIYNGTPTADGKCLGENPTFGDVHYVDYTKEYTLGGAGYMHNLMYNTSEWVTPTWGSYSVSGTKLAETDYDIVQQLYTPFTFSNGDWIGGKNSNNYSQRGTMSFKVKEAGNYFIHFYFSRDYYYDSVRIYKNDEEIIRLSYIQNSKEDSYPLNDLQESDVIKVVYDPSDSDNHSTFKFSIQRPTSSATDTRAYFGHGVEYSNGVYTLVDTIRNDGTKNISGHHYFCKNGATSCSSVYYAPGTYDQQYHAYKLDGGMTIEKFVNDQLFADDVNQEDSELKATIDSWFEANMLDYEEYLEDTVFCQNRNFAYERHGLNPDSGDLNGGYQGWGHQKNMSGSSEAIDTEDEGYLYNTNLKCPNVTDRFSVSNEKAKLTYPVATINYAEFMLLAPSTYSSGGGKVRGYNYDGDSSHYDYWLLSPNDILFSIYGWVASYRGSISYVRYDGNASVRPVVSLKAGTTYTKGDGSKENPYVIREYIYSKVETEYDSSKGTINIGEEDTDAVLNYTNVKFVVTPKAGYIIDSIEVIDKDDNSIPFGKTTRLNEYVFEMPDSDATIKATFKENDKDYSIVKGANQIVNKDNPDELIFGVDAEKELLDNAEVYIDGDLVDPDNYTIGDDSTIHFDDDYTKTLDNGDHTITLILDGVYQLTANFKVKDNRVNPNTGNRILTIVIIGLIALYVFATIIQTKKKFNITKFESID